MYDGSKIRAVSTVIIHYIEYITYSPWTLTLADI